MIGDRGNLAEALLKLRQQESAGTCLLALPQSEARKRDVPRGFIVRDGFLLTLATKRPPPSS